MKRAISLLLSLMMIISFAGCDQHNATNTIDTEVTENETKKEVEYIFYSDSADCVSSVNPSGEFKSTNCLKLSPYIGEISAIKDPEKTQVVFLDGQEYEAEYFCTRKAVSDDCKNEKINQYAITDRYIRHLEDGTQLELNLYADGTLKHFSISSWRKDKDIPRGDFTDEKAISKAKDVLAQVYGENIFDDYEFYTTFRSNNQEKLFVDFVRIWHGYQVASYLRVAFNNNGELRWLDCFQHFMFEAIENDVTKEMIQKAEEALRKAVPDNMTIKENSVAVEMDFNTGKLYLGLYAWYNDQPEYTEEGLLRKPGEFFYVNIE